jgi:hypothetical protein
LRRTCPASRRKGLAVLHEVWGRTRLTALDSTSSQARL